MNATALDPNNPYDSFPSTGNEPPKKHKEEDNTTSYVQMFRTFSHHLFRDIKLIYTNADVDGEGKIDKATRDKRIASVAFRVMGCLLAWATAAKLLVAASLILRLHPLSATAMLALAGISYIVSHDLITTGMNQRDLLPKHIKNPHFNQSPSKDFNNTEEPLPYELKDTLMAGAIYHGLSPKNQARVQTFFH